MIAPARRAAHRVLRSVHTGRSDLSTALARARRPLEDTRDRALAGEIAVGTLRWRAAVDHLLAQVSSRPIEDLDPEVRDLLRAASYQLRWLERVPARAVVYDAVELAREFAPPGTDRFVNGVLRTLADARRPTSLPPRPDTSAGTKDRRAVLDYLSVTESHPRWLVERWLDRHGLAAASAWVRFNNKPAPVTLQANQLKGSTRDLADRLAAYGVQTAPARWAPDALRVTAGLPLATPLTAEGRLLVQDEAAQLVMALVDAGRDTRVLDVCAAPGGKTVGLAGAMANHGLLVAADLRPRRLALLAATLARCGVRCGHVVRLDGTASLPFDAVFDRVLVDAPCSGLGTLRSDPDIRWRHEPKSLVALAAQQLTLLSQAAAIVRPGGILVYATCSSEPEENEETVGRFEAMRPDFTAVAPAESRFGRFIDPAGHFRTLPFRDGLQAFYAAVLRRHTL